MTFQKCKRELMAELDVPSFKKYSIFIAFWELHIMYFDHIQHPHFSPNSFEILSSPNFMLSFFFSLSFLPSLFLF